MSGSQAAAGLFASSFPELHKLGCWSKEKSVVKKNKQQTRFNEHQKKELEKFIGSSANEEEIAKKYKFIKEIYGQPFQRSCREEYNSYIKSAEFVFDQDIDDMILFLHLKKQKCSLLKHLCFIKRVAGTRNVIKKKYLLIFICYNNIFFFFFFLSELKMFLPE